MIYSHYSGPGLRTGTSAPLENTAITAEASTTMPHKRPYGEFLSNLPSQCWCGLTSAATGEIQFRHLWGKDKRAELLKSLAHESKEIYTRLKPPLEVGLPFLPTKTEAGFFKWPL